MDDRERNIIEAANRVFLRYGVKRASMGDIAAEAGVARQTLYNVYANKTDILRAAISLFGETAARAIDEGLPGCATLEDKIALVLEETVRKPYALLHSSPNAQDLIDGYNEAGREELECAAEVSRGQLAAVFAPYTAALSAQGLTPEGLAETLQRAGMGFKYQARDSAHLDALITALIRMALAAVAAQTADAEDAPAALARRG